MSERSATAPTPKQLAYITTLARRWSLSDRALDAWCRHRFRRTLVWLNRQQASDLIDDLANWTELPPELAVIQGQTVLPGMNALIRDYTG